jgi:hypothetical protein
MAFLGIKTGIFKTSSGQPTKFAKAFVSPSGNPSTFAKILNTTLDVVSVVPIVGGAASKAGQIGVKAAVKTAAKTAAKEAGKQAVKISAKTAITTALKTAAKVGVNQGSSIAAAVGALSSQAVSSAPVVAAEQYDFSSAKSQLGQAKTKEPTKEVSIFQWIEDFINSLFK